MSFRTKKSLGQHFLTDKMVLFQIMDSINAEKDDRIIEIGSGTGALTKWLAEKFTDVHAIELDQRAVQILQKKFDQVTIHQQDVLKVNWPDMVDSQKPNIVVGNLPITSLHLYYLICLKIDHFSPKPS